MTVARIAQLEARLVELDAEREAAVAELSHLRREHEQEQPASSDAPGDPHDNCHESSKGLAAAAVLPRYESLFSRADAERYSRHLLVPAIGSAGQARILRSRVLVVGAGGLGSTVLMYLAAAGVGTIVVVDHDRVEMSNLQRQIVHGEDSVGEFKAVSAQRAVHRLNSNVKCIAVCEIFGPRNAEQLVQDCDIVIDCVDNPPARYCMSDACVKFGKAMVGGAALKLEGMVSVFNHGTAPCYRCMYPKPPPPETLTNCSDGGVLGVVPGLVGCIQALEALKILSGGPVFSDPSALMAGRMLILDAAAARFTTIKLRGRNPECPCCGSSPDLALRDISSFDYDAFCGTARVGDGGCMLGEQPAKLPAEHIATVQDLCTELSSSSSSSSATELSSSLPLVIDVRDKLQYDIVHLVGSQHVDPDLFPAQLDDLVSRHISTSSNRNVFVVCRRGVLSSWALSEVIDSHKLAEISSKHNVVVRHVKGGWQSWAKQIDPRFPMY